MKKRILYLSLFLCAYVSMAQTTKFNYKELDGKYAEKLSTIDGAINTLYNVISGPKGEERNWELLRYLFHPEAKLIASGKKKDGSNGARYVTMDHYVENSGKWMLENGFFEKELHRVTEQFGQIAHVFSTYECFNNEDDKEPFMRGINSVQLMYTGKRWAVMSIYFTQETPENPIPEKYLPKQEEKQMEKKVKKKRVRKNSEIIKSAANTTAIPFSKAGNLIAVDVLLNGTKKKFILDTGSPRVIINSKYETSKDQAENKKVSAKGVNGNISNMSMVKINSLDFYGNKMIDQDVLSLDLSHLEKEFNQEIYGLIGYEMVKDYDILFDYKSQTLTLIKPEYFETYKDEQLKSKKLNKVSMTLNQHIPVIEVLVDNQKLALGIDSGAETNILDETLYSQFKSVTKKQVTEDLIGADNETKTIVKGTLKKMTIGGNTFKNLATGYSDVSHLNNAYKLNVDGLIGYPILSNQLTVLSYARNELIFIE